MSNNTTTIEASPAISLLYNLMAQKDLPLPTPEEMSGAGIDTNDATIIKEIVTVTRENNRQLQSYYDESNKPVLEKRISNALMMEEEAGKSGKKTMELVAELKESLISNATGTLSAFNRVILFYSIAFFLGIAMLVAAVVFGAMGKTVLAVAFGTIGLIDIVTYFVKLPANKIQESRSNLSQLQVVLLVWLKDLINNEVLSGKLINTSSPSIKDYKDLADINIENTGKLLSMIETMAEPKN